MSRKVLSKELCLGLFWSVTFLNSVLLTLRLHTRLRIHQKLRADDYALIFAYFVALVGGVSYTWMIDTYVQLYPFEEGIADENTPFPPRAQLLGTWDMVFDVIYISSNWAVKLSFLLFLRRILQPIPDYMKWWWACAATWALLLLGNYLSIIWLCQHSRHNITSKDQCNNAIDRYLVLRILSYSCVSDIVIDLLILILPYPLLSKLKTIGRRQKFGLYCIFSLALVTMGLAAFRIAYQLSPAKYNLNHMTGWFVTWMECATSILMGCIPGLVPMMRRRSSPPISNPPANHEAGAEDIEANPTSPPMNMRQQKRKSRDPWEVPTWLMVTTRRGSAAPQLETIPAQRLMKGAISERTEPTTVGTSSIIETQTKPHEI